MKVEWKQQPNTHKTSCVTLSYRNTGCRFRFVGAALYYLCIKFPGNSSQIAGKSMSHNYRMKQQKVEMSKKVFLY